MNATSNRCGCTGVEAGPSREQERLIEAFVGPGAVGYYQQAFSRIERHGLPVTHLNLGAALAGQFWGAYRRIWELYWLIMCTDAAALVLLAGTWAKEGITVRSLVLPLLIILSGRLLTGAIADRIYYRRYLNWRTRRSETYGRSRQRVAIAFGFLLLSLPLLVYRATQVPPSARDCRRLLDTFSGSAEMTAHQQINCLLIGDFPLGRVAGNWIGSQLNRAIEWLSQSFAWFFKSVTWLIRAILELLSDVFVGTPWPVVMTILVVAAWARGGKKVAVFVLGALAYIATMGFWSQAMSTLSLVAAATFISIVIGLPVGIWCSKSDRAYRVMRPVLDVMQTVPSFVYLIPAIAFFSIGPPPAVLATIIFSTPPVIRLTVLGIRQVPMTVKEAAIAYGATSQQLLWKVEIPLASRSIMTGVNQTILLSLSMSVTAALIGAGGLGYEVLFALQNVDPGRGILAGVAIALCAMIMDRIVQAEPGRKQTLS